MTWGVFGAKIPTAMGWHPSYAFRDCPWCGLRDAHMNPMNTDVLTAGPDKQRWWSFMSCPRCANLIVLETSPKNETERIIRTIPEPGHTPDVAHLPEDVATYYREAIQILDVGVSSAAAVQLRKTLEAAAAHFGVDRGSLVNRVRGLIKAGLITSQFGQALDYIRVIGNVGAHATDQRLDEETVRRALRFTTQALRNLFEIPAELEALKQGAKEEAEEVGEGVGEEGSS